MMHLKSVAAVAAAAVLLLGACGGGDDDDDASSDPGSNDSSGATETATNETGGADNEESEGVRVPLEAGSTGEITAPDVGTVRMTIVQIISPADEILGFGLTVDPGFQLWAVEATIEVTGGENGGAVPDWTVQTDKGNTYGWTGTASGNDLWGGEIGPDSPAEGYIAFQIPADEQVVSLTALFSIYVGYDMIFER